MEIFYVLDKIIIGKRFMINLKENLSPFLKDKLLKIVKSL